MEYEDRVAIPTPEGVDVELVLSGLGSRLSARLIDFVLQGILASLVAIIVGLVAAGLSGSAALASGAAGGFAFFAILFYDVFFEAFKEGQTPGKRRLGIRVVGDGGEPISFRAALVRNVLRLVDEFATLFLAGLISIARSERNQRLGDMAAGTIVVLVSDRGAGRADLTVSLAVVPVLERAGSWDVSAVSEEEVEAVRQFLGRRPGLEPASRGRLAARLAGRIRAGVVGIEPGIGDEPLLEVVAALKARR